MRCAIRDQQLFGVCMTVWTHANVRSHFFLPSCGFYSFTWVSMAFERVYQMSNVWMPFNVWMMFPDFKVSWELQSNVILHCVMSFILEHIYLQCSAMFSLVCYGFYFLFTILRYGFYLLFTIFFSTAADNKHS